MQSTMQARSLLDVIKVFGVDNLNSMTKYPSIQTYHEINRGCVNQNLTNNEGFEDENVYITEKIDGTNGRIIFLNDDYIIGSREELLYRKGDTFGNPSQGIVDIMRLYADMMVDKVPHDGVLRVFYGEVFGSNINGAKQYTKHRTSSVNFFDCIEFNDGFEEIIQKPTERISIWRENGGQPFLGVTEFRNKFIDMGYAGNIVPDIGVIYGYDMPTERSETYEWLKQFENTKACLDTEKFTGRAEGVVIRNESRTMIRKIRFEDYEKTIRKEGRL